MHVVALPHLIGSGNIDIDARGWTVPVADTDQELCDVRAMMALTRS